MNVKREARAFLVWRTARELDWQCTCRELARLTGLRYDEVTAVCRERPHWRILRPSPAFARHMNRLRQLDEGDIPPPVDEVLNGVAA